MTAIDSCTLWRDVPSWFRLSGDYSTHIDRPYSVLPDTVDDGVRALEISFDGNLWPYPFEADFGEDNCRVRVNQNDLLIPLRCLNGSGSYGLVVGAGIGPM